MKRGLGSLALATTLALAVGATAAPVAAVDDATVMFVQGLPGKAVELCVNGSELKSNFQYGGKFKKKFGAGTYNIKVRNRAAGVCKGSLIVKRTINLSELQSITAVASRNGKGLLVHIFDNDAVFKMTSRPAASESAAVVSHAAKTGAVDAFIAHVITPTAPTPTLSDIKQGKQKGIFLNEGFYSSWLAKKGTDAPTFGPSNKITKVAKVNFYVAVGTKKGNFKLVFYRLPFPVS